MCAQLVFGQVSTLNAQSVLHQLCNETAESIEAVGEAVGGLAALLEVARCRDKLASAERWCSANGTAPSSRRCSRSLRPLESTPPADGRSCTLHSLTIIRTPTSTIGLWCTFTGGP